MTARLLRRAAAALLACVPLLALGCATGGGPGRSAPGYYGARRDDRVLVTAFNNITAVAVSPGLVFAAVPGALGILDRRMGGWMPPLTVAEGYPADQVSLVAADPNEDAVWVGGFGTVIFYEPSTDQLIRAVVSGFPDAILFDKRNPLGGAYVHSGGGWSLVSRTGNSTPVDNSMLPPPEARLQPPTTRDVYAQFPSLQSFGALLTRDERLRSWPVSAASKSPLTNEVWLGTRGNGLYKVDPVFNQSEHVPFGLLDPGAAALAPAADGVWIAGLANDAYARGGLTFASDDLQHWRWLQGPVNDPLNGARANALALRDGIAWVATDRGVVRLDTENPLDTRTWSGTNGLPVDRALSLAVTNGGAWVGTGAGLVFVSDPGRTRGAARGAVSDIMLSGMSVRALVLVRDTLWIGTDAGLLVLPAASQDSALRRPAGVGDEPRLRRRVLAMAWSDTVLAVATDEELLQVSLTSGIALPRFDALSIAGVRGTNHLAIDSRSIVLAGDGGVLEITRRGALARLIPSPVQIPGSAFDVLLDDEFVWVATRGGVLRLRRLPDGSTR